MATIADARTFATTGVGGQIDKAAGDYGAIYFPWIYAPDPIGQGRNPKILLPPSGFMAGIYARTDNSRGVFKAPAGTEAGVAGALAPYVTVSDVEQDQLNPILVNVIRTVPGSGLVVWGTRTIGSDASWRYIPGAPHGDLPARQHLQRDSVGRLRAQRRTALVESAG